jgi:DNA-directed RNA polymerase specialized sigma24 family protein
VVALHYGHGYTVAESAELMGCSAGAAASHLSRALARLRKELTDD